MNSLGNKVSMVSRYKSSIVPVIKKNKQGPEAGTFSFIRTLSNNLII